MAITVTINAVDRTSKTLLNQMTIDMTLGSDWTATIPVRDTISTSSAYRPSLDHVVSIADGGTTLFHGTVTRVEDKPITGPHIGTLTVITARAKSQVVDQIVVNEEYAAGQTLHDVVADLRTTYLAPYSITLDAGMGTGATLEAQTFVDVTLREVLNHLSEITGWVWRITPSDVLEFFSVGTKTTSYSMTAANKESMGPITWDKGRQQYVNSIHLRYGTATVVSKTFTATGTGAISSWVLDYDPATNAEGYLLSAGYVTENGSYATLSPPSQGGMYTWTAATNTLTRAAGNLPNGQVITLVYSVQFPLVVTVEDAGEIASNGTFAKLFEAPDIFDKDAATELATGLLRRALAIPQWVHVSTKRASGFVMPGDQITLTFSDRTVSGSHLITQVRMGTIAKGTATYNLTCLSGSELQTTWTDQLRGILGSGGANAAGGTITGSIVPNFSGHFDGDVIANAGKSNTAGPREAALVGSYGNASVEGPALMLGRSTETFRWGIIANSLKGSTPGTVSSLEFVSDQDSGTYRRAVTFTQADTPVAGEYYLVGSVPGKLSIGAPSGTLGGFSGNARMEAVFANSFFESTRSVAMGYWTSVSFNAADYSADTGTWVVASGDLTVDTAYTFVGKTLVLSFAVVTTTTTGSPNYLKIALPSGLTVATGRRADSVCLTYAPDGTTFEAGKINAMAGESFIRLYRYPSFAAFPNVTNTLLIQGTAMVPVA
jgi:hypothetical protein